MRYRYYRIGSPITDEVMPMVVASGGIKVFQPAGEVRCVVPYFSDYLNAECYGYVEYDTQAGAFPPPCIMGEGWSALYVVMDVADDRGIAKHGDNSELQREVRPTVRD